MFLEKSCVLRLLFLLITLTNCLLFYRRSIFAERPSKYTVASCQFLIRTNARSLEHKLLKLISICNLHLRTKESYWHLLSSRLIERALIVQKFERSIRTVSNKIFANEMNYKLTEEIVSLCFFNLFTCFLHIIT